MSNHASRWSTAAGLAWWKKLLMVLAGLAVYAASALTGHYGSCSGPFSHRCGSVQIVQVPRQLAISGWMVPRLYRRGLRIAIPEPWGISNSYQPGPLIISPKPGRRVPEGTVVRLDMVGLVGMLSATAPGTYAVPNVAGKKLSAALASLTEAGVPFSIRAAPLPAGRIFNIMASYCITSQKPLGGTTMMFSQPDSHLWVKLAAQPC